MAKSLQYTHYWSHTLAEYQAMFNLLDLKPCASILHYRAGSSSLAAELAASQHAVTAVDPFYVNSYTELKEKSLRHFKLAMEEIACFKDQFSWRFFENYQALEEAWQKALELFFADFEEGQQVGRYIAAEPLALPFETGQFDIALSSYSLFNLSAEPKASKEFLLQPIKALCRVAREVRIFPLLDARGEISPLLGPVISQLQQENYSIELKQVSFDFQPGGNAMMCVSAQACVIHN